MSIDNIKLNKYYEKAFLIHFRFKSTEEVINKYKRGYSNWFGNKENEKGFINRNLGDYFEENELTLDKINYIERELKYNLLYYRIIYYFRKILLLDKINHIVFKTR